MKVTCYDSQEVPLHYPIIEATLMECWQGGGSSSSCSSSCRKQLGRIVCSSLQGAGKNGIGLVALPGRPYFPLHRSPFFPSLRHQNQNWRTSTFETNNRIYRIQSTSTLNKTTNQRILPLRLSASTTAMTTSWRKTTRASSFSGKSGTLSKLAVNARVENGYVIPSRRTLRTETTVTTTTTLTATTITETRSKWCPPMKIFQSTERSTVFWYYRSATFSSTTNSTQPPRWTFLMASRRSLGFASSSSDLSVESFMEYPRRMCSERNCWKLLTLRKIRTSSWMSSERDRSPSHFVHRSLFTHLPLNNSAFPRHFGLDSSSDNFRGCSCMQGAISKKS